MKAVPQILMLMLCQVAQVTLVFAARPSGSMNSQVTINIINGSGSKIGVWWINFNVGGDNVPMGNVPMGDRIALDSLSGHEFELRELPDPSTGECNSKDKTCRMAILRVKTGGEHLYSVNSNFQIEYDDILLADAELLKTDDYVSYCKSKALGDDSADKEVILNRFKYCVSQGLGRQLREAEEELKFVQNVRQSIGGNMENFTCAMLDKESSPDVSTYDWVSDKDEVSRTVHVKFDRPAARIHLIENFATEEECMAYEKEAASKLARASTGDGKGGTRVSLHRKAMQASIFPKWELEEEGDDKIVQLSRRVYDYTNHVLGLNISEEGQEPIMSIQYEGRGLNDTEPDRYTPHCDGDCMGTPHRIGGRMATMVIYCTVPEIGGHTNFRNANVHIKPSAGSGIFFGYMDPETKVMDTEYTTHSGCPVYEGQKKIITQWVRWGVSKEFHSESLNSLGIRYADSGDY